MIRAGKFLLCAAVAAGPLLAAGFQVVVVPTASMERTVLVGDHLLINRFEYGPEVPFLDARLPRLRAVARDDVVSFHRPGNGQEVYLKRAVTVGGDRVQWREGTLYVNRERRAEPYLESQAGMGNSPEIVVPPGQLYLLGDNRDHSEDGRVFGTVPEEDVIGEPVMVLWSIAAPTREWLTSRTAAYLDYPVAHCGGLGGFMPSTEAPPTRYETARPGSAFCASWPLVRRPASAAGPSLAECRENTTYQRD